jgi:hypothetical protein
MRYKIVETDNFDGDYPIEKFLTEYTMTEDHAKAVADAVNNGFGDMYPRYWKVVPADYVLQTGFEP